MVTTAARQPLEAPQGKDTFVPFLQTFGEQLVSSPPSQILSQHRCKGLYVEPHSLTQRSGSGGKDCCRPHPCSAPPPIQFCPPHMENAQHQQDKTYCSPAVQGCLRACLLAKLGMPYNTFVTLAQAVHLYCPRWRGSGLSPYNWICLCFSIWNDILLKTALARQTHTPTTFSSILI